MSGLNIFYLSAVLAAALLTVGCDRAGAGTSEPEQSDPEIIIGRKGSLACSYEGGAAGFGFEVVNPREDGLLSAKASDDWVSGVVCGEDTVTFTVAANTDDAQREATVTVVYEYGGGRTVEGRVSVLQDAAPLIEEDYDVEIDAVYSDAVYQSDADGLMDVRMVFTDMKVSGDQVSPPGALLYVEALTALDPDGTLQTGEYVMALANEPFTVFPGQVIDVEGVSLTIGTSLALFDESGARTEHLVTGGSMTVNGTPENYDIECRFETESGMSIKCVWSGPLKVRNVPGPFSTLTEDYTLDFSRAVGTARYFADLYGTGGSNWFIELKPSDGNTGDGMNIDLVCETSDFADGISSGTYTAAPGDSPVPGEYLRGTMNAYGLYGTVYMGDYVYGYPESYAPAVSGELTVAAGEDGVYTVEFSFTDDRGHTWDGSWTGHLELSNARP